jgi:hypothetical protein
VLVSPPLLGRGTRCAFVSVQKEMAICEIANADVVIVNFGTPLLCYGGIKRRGGARENVGFISSRSVGT